MKIEELDKICKEQKKFTCSHCKKNYDINPEWDAASEAKELWGSHSERDDQVVLCDDCFNEFMEFKKC